MPSKMSLKDEFLSSVEPKKDEEIEKESAEARINQLMERKNICLMLINAIVELPDARTNKVFLSKEIKAKEELERTVRELILTLEGILYKE